MLGILSALFAQLPDSSADGDIVPFLIVFVFGFLIAIVGHLTDSRALIVAGIVIAGMAATLPWLVWG